MGKKVLFIGKPFAYELIESYLGKQDGCSVRRADSEAGDRDTWFEGEGSLELTVLDQDEAFAEGVDPIPAGLDPDLVIFPVSANYQEAYKRMVAQMTGAPKTVRSVGYVDVHLEARDLQEVYETFEPLGRQNRKIVLKGMANPDDIVEALSPFI